MDEHQNDSNDSMEEPDSHAGGAQASDEQSAGEAGAELPPLHKRIIDVFFSPGRLMEALAAKPAWGAALVVMLLLLVVQTALIPVDLLVEAQRDAIVERGGDPSQIPDSMGTIMRIVGPLFGAIGVLIFTFIFAGLYTLIFSFVLGDEGKFKQYLAVVTHAWIIAMVIGLVITPLKISSGNPQLTVNLSGFLFFLEEGSYGLAAVRMIDMSAVWASLVIAQGAHAIDRNRSFMSAAIVTVGLQLVIAFVMAIWIR